MADGKGCKCEAWTYLECCCPDVDWTPQEVYTLREENKRLREALESVMKASNILLSKFGYDVEEDKCSDQETRDHYNAHFIDYIDAIQEAKQALNQGVSRDE